MTKKLILLVISISFALLSSELGIRYLRLAWPFEDDLYNPPYLTTRDAPLLWRFPPSGKRNSLGLRNREVEQKKSGSYRILFLGDSLVWSGETSSGKLYTEVLEQRLNARSPKGTPSFEVINAGIPGYTTYQELEFLKIYGLDMEPDLVILGFVFNDLYYKYLHKPTKRGLLSGEPTIHLYRFNPNAFPGNLVARSHLAHTLAFEIELLWKKVRHQPIFPFEVRLDFYLAWKEYAWDRTQELIGEMKTVLAKRGIPLLIVSFPVTTQVDDRYRRLDQTYVLLPQRKLREICNAYAIPMLDLTDTLYKNGGPALFRDFLHLDPKGNDQITDEIMEFLAAEFGGLAAGARGGMAFKP